MGVKIFNTRGHNIPFFVDFTTFNATAKRLGLDASSLVIDRKPHRAPCGFYLAILGFDKVVWAQLDDGWFLHGGRRGAQHLIWEMRASLLRARDLYDPGEAE